MSGGGSRPDAVDRQKEPIEQRFRPRWTTRDEDVDGHDLAYPARGGVGVSEYPPAARARAHGDHDLGVRRGFEGPLRRASSRFLEATPVTSSTSAWRGEATKWIPNRSMSYTGLLRAETSTSQPLQEPASTSLIASDRPSSFLILWLSLAPISSTVWLGPPSPGAGHLRNQEVAPGSHRDGEAVDHLESLGSDLLAHPAHDAFALVEGRSLPGPRLWPWTRRPPLRA